LPLAQLTVKTKFDNKIIPSDSNKFYYDDETGKSDFLPQDPAGFYFCRFADISGIMFQVRGDN